MSVASVCAITGSTGYVGSVIADQLAKNYALVHLTRKTGLPSSLAWDFNSARDITGELQSQNVKVLVHAAWDMKANSLEELNRICVDGSKRLFDMARRAGVERIVFMSSISAFPGCRSAYGRSKLSVEALVAQAGGVILRPGLVHGPHSGGLFGTIRHQIQNSKIVPLIGNGQNPQYLLDEQTLASVVLRAVEGDLDLARSQPLTIAYPRPWPFRQLVHSLAIEQKRSVSFLPVPWPLLYGGLRFFEALHAKLPVRSDSVLSFIYQDPHPDFSKLREYRIDPVPFEPARL